MKRGPFIKSTRAKKMPGQTVAIGGTQIISKKGKKPISFKKGGLHKALNVPQGESIPSDKMASALAGRYGMKVKKMALFAQNVLKKGQRTARSHYRR